MKQGDLQTVVAAWKPAPKKRGKATAKSKSTASRLESARKLAQLSIDAQPSDELIDALEAAAEAYPDEKEIRRAHGRALCEAGRIGEAIAELEERLQAHPEDTDDLIDVSELYERTKRPDLAVDRLRRAVDQLVAAGDLARAIPAAKRLIDLEPLSLETASDLVSLLRAHDPKLLVEGIEHLADIYRTRGKLGQEAAACCELLSLAPDRGDVKDRLASIYTRILDVDPDDGDAWVGLAAIDEPLAEQLRVILAPAEPADGRPDQNITPIEQHQTYAMRKARELIDAGDMAGAALCLERVVRTNPSPGNRLLLGRCYRDCHKDEAAVEQGLRALADAHVAGDFDLADQALQWVCDAVPGVKGPLADAVFLNHRPVSADALYEELRSLWDETVEALNATADASE
jgi:tetratricopeptide (TPR) repeat protein